MNSSPIWRINGEPVGVLVARNRSTNTPLAGESISLTAAAQAVSTYQKDATFVLGRVLSSEVRVYLPAGETPAGLLVGLRS